MKFKYFTILFLMLSISVQAENANLIKAIQESNIEYVKRILNNSSLSFDEKQAFLDLAQNIIIQRNNEVFLSGVRPIFKTILLRSCSILLFINSFIPFFIALDSEVPLDIYKYVFTGLAGMGVSILIFLKGDQYQTAHQKVIYKYYLDALEIKHLLFRNQPCK